ncbi:MAG: hypothetical protein II971_03575 [Firmicutes bacterium]|nr:hypothetical protein [Bacillota bacterium]
MKNNMLDERQEQVLEGIESRGCWIAFWGLLAAIIVQSLMGRGADSFAGEWIVFMILSVYLLAGCLKNGIWDRKIAPKTSTNIKASILAGAVVGLITFVNLHVRLGLEMGSSLLASALTWAGTSLLCVLALTAALASYNKKKKALEEEPEEMA